MRSLSNMKVGIVVLLVLPILVPAWNPKCISTPVGFGRNTTGGSGGRTVVPTSLSQLTDFLKSTERLIIDLQTTFDFTKSEGTANDKGCFYNNCGGNGQKSLIHDSTSCANRNSTTVSYYKAGTTGLIVSSNKTIRSTNGKGVLVGKGLRISLANNVIVRDITFQDINPQVIWGGDAIIFDRVSNVWIHNCTFRRIGRMHLVTWTYANTGITVSSCQFDGTTPYSVYCDGQHYWLWLFWGTNDQITLFNNRVYNVAGRIPHASGTSTAKSVVHLVGNEFDTNKHNGMEPRRGSYILAEGNKFINYRNVVLPSAQGGFLELIDTAAQAATCQAYFGQSCKVNTYQNTTRSPARADIAVLNQFSKLDRTAINGARAAVCE
ncbi:probable pectin lyase D [Thrips palmi]|uniref:pectin lyase n=1 Tax=Thrips palmi TaxID=161013 RepID=A0A6P9AA37_THRPL|nr:probable pectin lyase D [Thrips palmi]